MIILGYRDTPISLGTVDNFECPRCLHQSSWHLSHLKKFFTVFFIPIMCTGHVYTLTCEHCGYEDILSKMDFINYKAKHDIELSFSEGEISGEEKKMKLKEINIILEQEKEIKRKKAIEESMEWIELASKKSDEELLTIYFKERHKYLPSLLIAVTNEMTKRKLI